MNLFTWRGQFTWNVGWWLLRSLSISNCRWARKQKSADVLASLHPSSWLSARLLTIYFTSRRKYTLDTQLHSNCGAHKNNHFRVTSTTKRMRPTTHTLTITYFQCKTSKNIPSYRWNVSIEKWEINQYNQNLLMSLMVCLTTTLIYWC